MPAALRSTRCANDSAVSAALAPVAQHHRRGGAAAERFGLRDVGNVDERDGWRAPARAPPVRTAEGRGVPRTIRNQPATTMRMITSSAMMISVVEMVMVDWPPASARSTWRACAASVRQRPAPSSVATAPPPCADRGRPRRRRPSLRRARAAAAPPHDRRPAVLTCCCRAASSADCGAACVVCASAGGLPRHREENGQNPNGHAHA